MAALAGQNYGAVVLILYEFSYDLGGFLDFLGGGLPLRLLTLITSYGYIKETRELSSRGIKRYEDKRNEA